MPHIFTIHISLKEYMIIILAKKQMSAGALRASENGAPNDRNTHSKSKSRPPARREMTNNGGRQKIPTELGKLGGKVSLRSFPSIRGEERRPDPIERRKSSLGKPTSADSRPETWIWIPSSSHLSGENDNGKKNMKMRPEAKRLPKWTQSSTTFHFLQ